MNNKLFLTLLSIFLSLTYSHAQLLKTIDVSTPGTLSVSLGDDKTKVTDLTITGTINDADFTTIKQMSVLKVLDMSGVEIVNATIPAYAFSGANMVELILPSSLKTIDSFAFASSSFNRLDLSSCNQLETMGREVFKRSKITNGVDLSQCSSLVNFGVECFYQSTLHVILPLNLKKINDGTFIYFLGTVDLPPVLETIGASAFSGANMVELILPSSLKTIDSFAFNSSIFNRLDLSSCSQLETMGREVFKRSKITNGVDLSQCSSLVNFGVECFYQSTLHVILPLNLKKINDGTFIWFLGTVDLPPVLETIGASAFSGAQVTNLFFPDSLSLIGNNGLYNCTKLETLVSLNPTPPALGANVFTGVDKVACTLYVPTGSVELYQAAAQWKDFLIEEYKVSLIDNLVFQKSTEENLYQVKTGEKFTVDVYANFMSEVRLGLFNASNGTFIEDIVSNKSNNRYTCQVSTNLLSGSYLIQPYILEKGEVKAISRKAGSHIIDRLLITVKNNWAGSPFTGVTAELNNHLQISTGQEDLLEIATNKSFKVLVRYATSLATDIKIGLFDPTTGLLVSDVTKSVEGNIFTCKVPTALADAKYNLIPYQVIDGNNVYVERLTDKSFLVDRLPLSVVLGEPEEVVAGCLTIEAIDSNSNNQLIGGKYSIKGDSIQEEYILTADGLKLENLPQGDYTITEVYPVGKYKPSSIKEQRVSIMLSNDCQTVTFKYSLIPNKVDLVFNLNSDTTHYTGVRVGEYYWMDRNIYKPVDGKQVTADDINNSHTWYRMFQYHGDPLYTDLVSVSDFNKYYGQYYSRGAYEYILYNAKMQESVNGVTSITATSWGDAWITGGLQLIGMCGNVSKDEVKQYLSYGYNSNGNNPPVVIQPKNYFDWFYHSYGNTVNFLDKNYETNGFDPNNTNKYGFNLLPNGSRFNGPGVMHLNHDGKDDQEDIPVVAGDFNGLNQKAAFNLSMSGLDIAEAPQMHYIKVNHWSTVRLTRRLTNEELGYKLYINRVNYQGVSPYGTVKNSDDYIVKCIWKTANLHPELDAKTIIRDYLKLDIIKLGLNEAAPEGYSELPNGLIRGLYVQHFIETPNGGRTVKSVDDIVYIAQFNPLLWAPIYNEQGVYQPHNDIGVDLVPSTRSLQVATPELDNSPVSIYPNPVTDILYLESGASISEVQVYSTNGKMVLKQANVGSSINVGHLASGTYVLKLQIGDKSYTHKMIKK
ncbi:leucine-rich repeat domain-containing protein [Dysgonomonas sp. HGC4]|uniref:leucine-rich repeat domain-containing protein n=1 Tax=Dysgonomonas sp. HGC4 TaxID=1658009 RepID=UPI0006830933|nr:leucine-rich repeat protein [Dysgonomonas sp. HGC4]MBD8346528.1 leucine-rich repeat protein [Dysgonomonas sp. HGC4]